MVEGGSLVGDISLLVEESNVVTTVCSCLLDLLSDNGTLVTTVVVSTDEIEMGVEATLTLTLLTCPFNVTVGSGDVVTLMGVKALRDGLFRLLLICGREIGSS